MTNPMLGLALLILLAKVLEEVAARLRQPPLLGDVVAGLPMGPLGFSAVHPSDELELFITIGIFFLVGLEEIDVAGFLANLRTRLFVASVAAFAAPFALVMVVCRYFGLG